MIVVVVLVALYFEFTNGFHDTANTVATCIATKAVKPRIAIAGCAILNFVGALLAVEVAKTIAGGIVDAGGITTSVVLCGLLAATAWNLITWWLGMPVSSSQALMGGLIGATLAHGGAVLWASFGQKALIPMLISPILGLGIAYLVLEVLEHMKISHKKWSNKFYKSAQLFSAGALSLSHGMNDAQKSMGIITLALFTGGWASQDMAVPLWVKIACAVTIALGTAMGGARIIKTMGYKITKLRPIDGFAAEGSSAIVISAASHWGMPISTTYTVTSAVMGTGLVKGQRLRQSVVLNILKTWAFTFPATIALAWVLQMVAKWVFKA